jgi:hypothetical protein
MWQCTVPVPDVNALLQVEDLGGARHKLGDGGGGQQLGVGRAAAVQQPLALPQALYAQKTQYR